MGLWDDFCDGVGDFICSGIDSVGSTACKGMDVIGNVASAAIDNPVEAVAIATATVATGGAAFAFAGPIAATIGGTGLLGAASTGTAIIDLVGAAKISASLAAVGGGAVAAGGGGMAAGTAAITTAGAATGAGLSASVIAGRKL